MRKVRYTSQLGRKTDRVMKEHPEERKQGALNPDPVMKVNSSRPTRPRSRIIWRPRSLPPRLSGRNKRQKVKVTCLSQRLRQNNKQLCNKERTLTEEKPVQGKVIAIGARPRADTHGRCQTLLQSEQAWHL